jgi:hypothetical protein
MIDRNRKETVGCREAKGNSILPDRLRDDLSSRKAVCFFRCCMNDVVRIRRKRRRRNFVMDDVVCVRRTNSVCFLRNRGFTCRLELLHDYKIIFPCF